MAFVRRGDRKSGPRYRVYWYDPGGKKRAKICRRRADAERFKREIEHTLYTGTYADPSRGRISVVEFWEDLPSGPLLGRVHHSRGQIDR